MKLKTTLIPISCLGLCGSIITPLTLTSCSNGGYIGRSFDLVKNFYPTVERHEHAILPLHEINEDYAATIIETPEVFVQDYMWGKCWSGFAFEQFLFWEQLLPYEHVEPRGDKDVLGAAKLIYSRDIETISNLIINKQEVTWNGVKWTFPTLSFTLDFLSEIRDIVFQDYYYEGELYSGSVNGYVSGTMKFYNVPFYIIPRTVATEDTVITYEVLSFEPFYEWMCGTEREIEPEKPLSWIIDLSVYSSISGQVTYSSGLTERIADDWRLIVSSDPDNPSWKYNNLTLRETVGMVFSSSYYLERVQLQREAN